MKYGIEKIETILFIIFCNQEMNPVKRLLKTQNGVQQNYYKSIILCEYKWMKSLRKQSTEYIEAINILKSGKNANFNEPTIDNDLHQFILQNYGYDFNTYEPTEEELIHSVRQSIKSKECARCKELEWELNYEWNEKNKAQIDDYFTDS